METPDDPVVEHAPTAGPEGIGAGSGAKLRAGWMRSPKGNLVPILFKDVNGWAIAEGCVILGRTSGLLDGMTAVALAPQNLVDGKKVLGNGIAGAQYRWPGNGAGGYDVPYQFASPLPQAQRDKVLEAIDHWAARTKIRFRPRLPTDADFVTIASADYCASAVGRQEGEQQIWLSGDCLVGNVIHEMGHTVGLWHEHTRADRDVYVEIVWSNVVAEARPNFVARVSDGEELGQYDYASIMHYPAQGFAIDPGAPTIIAPLGEAIGQRVGLSPGDIAAVALMYP